MRRMLLSFKADVYKRLASGEKIYEHRKVFPNEPIEAYLYVSAPVKAITGIIHLGKKIEIEEWKRKYSYDEEAVARIDEYLQHHKYAMEILDFQPTNSISLDKLRIDLGRFIVPQMYYFIDGLPLNDYLLENIVPTGKKIKHSFDDIPSTKICVH